VSSLTAQVSPELVDFIRIGKLFPYIEKAHIKLILAFMAKSSVIVENNLQNFIQYLTKTYLDEYDLSNWHSIIKNTNRYTDVTTNASERCNRSINECVAKSINSKKFLRAVENVQVFLLSVFLRHS
jgi:hypothetical protein